MEQKSLKIDGIDKIILHHLMLDARKPILSIAREVGVSGAAIHQRLKKIRSLGFDSGLKNYYKHRAIGL